MAFNYFHAMGLLFMAGQESTPQSASSFVWLTGGIFLIKKFTIFLSWFVISRQRFIKVSIFQAAS
jgi:hypothetical protein